MYLYRIGVKRNANAKSTYTIDIKIRSACTWETCIWNALKQEYSVKDICIEGAYIKSISIIDVKDACVYVNNTCIEDTYSNKDMCAGGTSSIGAIKSLEIHLQFFSGAYIRDTSVGDDCVGDVCIKHTSGINAVKYFNIYLQLSQILELRLYNSTLKTRVKASC